MQPTASEVQAQLERILGSSKFLASDQLSRFLRFVVEETLAGRAADIKQYTVAVKGLGHDASYNPQADPTVRVQARRLRGALSAYYDGQGSRDPVRIEIPKGAYVPSFQHFANSADPNGDSVIQEVASQTASQPPSQDDTPPTEPSIAVLPFIFLGNDQEEAYLGTGLTEEIVIALTRFPDFLVVGPLDRDKIWQQRLGTRGIGREYSVRFVLDGTVRRRGQTLRLTARLTDALSGHQLWGQAFDYDLETIPIIEIEDEIVGQVVATIADNFGIIPRALAKESLGRDTDCVSDYEAILRFHHYTSVLTEDSLVAAITALENTLQRDPNHAMAAALLADLTAGLYHMGYDDRKATLEEAETLGRKAVALDPNCQPARFAMALVHFLRFERERCLEEIDQGFSLNPNHANYVAASGLLLAMVGERARGLALMQKAMGLNPHHPGWYYLVPFIDAYRRGEYEAALADARRFNTPAYFWDPLIRAAVFAKLDCRAEAHAAAEELLALVPDFQRRGRSLIQRLVFLDQHVEMLLDGLCKAGLETGSGS